MANIVVVSIIALLMDYNSKLWKFCSRIPKERNLQLLAFNVGLAVISSLKSRLLGFPALISENVGIFSKVREKSGIITFTIM